MGKQETVQSKKNAIRWRRNRRRQRAKTDKQGVRGIRQKDSNKVGEQVKEIARQEERGRGGET